MDLLIGDGHRGLVKGAKRQRVAQMFWEHGYGYGQARALEIDAHALRKRARRLRAIARMKGGPLMSKVVALHSFAAHAVSHAR
jgi:hypothetical protein